jgi:hypothetical protein
VKRLRQWPPQPSTIVLVVVLGLGVVGGAALVWSVVSSPQVADEALPVPDGADVVGDVSLPEGGSSQSAAENRTISIADADLTVEQLYEAVLAELEDAGWQLEVGPLGPGSAVSTNEVAGAHDLDVRLRTGEDGDPPGVRSPPWEHGQPYVTVSAVAGDR